MNYSTYVPFLPTSSALWPADTALLAEPHPAYSKPLAEKKIYKRDDLLYKAVLEDLFDDFLRFVMPDADRHFDLSRGVEFLNQELEQLFPPEDDLYKPKVIDKLVKVFTKSGKEKWILCHLEVQDKYGADFGKRMFTYYYRIFDKYEKPITAFAILTEPSKKVRSNTFRLDTLGTSISYTFNVFKIAQQKDDMLKASENPFAIVVLIAKAALQGKRLDSNRRDAFLLGVKIDLTKQLLSKKIAREKIDALLQFLTYHIRFEEKTNNQSFKKELDNIIGKNNTMGIRELLEEHFRQEGKDEGIAEGKLQIAQELKKEGLSVAFIAKTTKLTEQQIEEL